MDFPEHAQKASENESSTYPYEAAFAPAATLFEYGRLLLRRKGVLLIAAVLGGSAGLLVSVPRTRIYQAHTTLEIQGLNENLLNTREVNPTIQSGNATAVEEMKTQIRILQSESLVGRVISKFGLNHSFIPPTRLERWRAALGFSKRPAGSDR